MKIVALRLLPLLGIMLIATGTVQARPADRDIPWGLLDAADNFAQATGNMHHLLRHAAGRSPATRAARRLVRAARHYRRAVERGRSWRHLRKRFEDLRYDLREFRHEYRHADVPTSRRHHRARRRLKRAFDDLRVALHQARHDAHRYGERPAHGGQRWRWRHRGAAEIDHGP